MAEEQLKMDQKQLQTAINFFIIWDMWKEIRGRKKIEGGNLYDRLGINRIRYGRILETGRIRYGKGELAYLKQETGLSIEVFEGTKPIALSFPPTVEKITEEEWRELFELRYIRSLKEKYPNAKDDCREKEDSICDRLKQAQRDNPSTEEFFCLCSYLKRGKRINHPMAEHPVVLLQASLKKIGLKELEGCDIKRLQTLSKQLKSADKLVSALITYKNAAHTEKLQSK